MAANGERLHQRVLHMGEMGGRMKLACGHREQRPQASVTVHAERLMVLTAVGQPALAGGTPLAIDVRLHAAAVARLDVRHPCADGHHLDPQFVPWDPRVAEEGHLAQVAAEVSAADADSVHANDCLAGERRRGLRDLDTPEILGLFQQQRLHWITFFRGGRFQGCRTGQPSRPRSPPGRRPGAGRKNPPRYRRPPSIHRRADRPASHCQT